MESYAKFLTAIAALIGAFAWPATIFLIVLLFRNQLQLVLARLPILLDRLKKATIPGVAVELDRIADAEVQSDKDKGGKITPTQVEAAARIEAQAKDTGSDEFSRELDRLCLEYDSLRRAMPPGAARTQAMTRVVVKMRSLAQSLVHSIDAYKSSGSPGSRLAAITMMQMVPHAADLVWLGERFSREQQAFLLYHAALALQNVANVSSTAKEQALLRDVAKEALAKLKSFPGVPDRNTIEILEMLLSTLSPA